MAERLRNAQTLPSIDLSEYLTRDAGSSEPDVANEIDELAALLASDRLSALRVAITVGRGDDDEGREMADRLVTALTTRSAGLAGRISVSRVDSVEGGARLTLTLAPSEGLLSTREHPNE